MCEGRRSPVPAALLLVVCAILPCTESARAEAAGRVAAPGLRVDRAINGEITLTWPEVTLSVCVRNTMSRGLMPNFSTNFINLSLSTPSSLSKGCFISPAGAPLLVYLGTVIPSSSTLFLTSDKR